jgi:phage/conjugal plasmid C-4 type zinc finger TraR family protein
MQRFADELDLAQMQTELNNQLHIAVVRNDLYGGRGASHCVDCGDPIPAARRYHVPNACRCIACQSDEERRRFEPRPKRWA